MFNIKKAKTINNLVVVPAVANIVSNIRNNTPKQKRIRKIQQEYSMYKVALGAGCYDILENIGDYQDDLPRFLRDLQAELLRRNYEF